MRYFGCLCVLLFWGCFQEESNSFAGGQYLPSTSQLEEGLVWKYYFHRGKHTEQRKTDIRYREITLSGDVLHHEDYNAAFQKVYDLVTRSENGKWLTVSESSINYRNLFTDSYRANEYVIEDDVHTNWGDSDALLVKSLLSEGTGHKIINRQLSIRDTIIAGKQCKVMVGEREFISFKEGAAQDTNFLTWEKVYQEGLGLLESKMKSELYYFDLQLDEVMTVAEFEQRANHDTHRVGYIDTLNTMDDHTLFEPCFHPSKINDYYNDRRAMMKGGKGRLRAMLQEKLDAKILEGQSGYLTYRFVINCHGEVGWFVTEEADLKYNRTEFSKACRDHLYELLKAEKEWTNLLVRTEDRDAYTYITFKIKDGEIIEILP